MQVEGGRGVSLPGRRMTVVIALGLVCPKIDTRSKGTSESFGDCIKQIVSEMECAMWKQSTDT